MRVLVVEPDTATARALELMLSHVGMITYRASLGRDAIDLAGLYDYDIITLSLDLEDMSGHEFLRQIREVKIVTPIIVVTAADDTENKIKAFGHGADDYLTKPFHREELIARIHAISRRNNGHVTSTLTVGNISLDLTRKSASVDGKPMHLTGKEYQLIEVLLMRSGQILTKEVLMNHLYGGMDEPELKIIDVFVCKLRKKLAEVGAGKNYIETIWGRGYTLAA